MKDLIHFLASSLVEHDEQVEVTEEETDQETVFKVKVASEDMGRIIGKQGRVAKALRTIMKAAAIKEGKRVQVEIVE